MDKYDYYDSTLGDFLGMENEYEMLSKKAKVSPPKHTVTRAAPSENRLVPSDRSITNPINRAIDVHLQKIGNEMNQS